MLNRIISFYFLSACIVLLFISFIFDQYKDVWSGKLGFEIGFIANIIIGLVSSFIAVGIWSLIKDKEKIELLKDKVQDGLKRKEITDIAQPARDLWRALLQDSFNKKDQELQTRAGIMHFSCLVSDDIKRRNFKRAKSNIEQIKRIINSGNAKNLKDPWINKFINWHKELEIAIDVYCGNSDLGISFVNLIDVANQLHLKINSEIPTLTETFGSYIQLCKREKSKDPLEELVFETLLIGALGSQKTLFSQFPLDNEILVSNVVEICKRNEIELNITPEFSLNKFSEKLLLDRVQIGMNFPEAVYRSQLNWQRKFGESALAVLFHRLNMNYIINGSVIDQCEAIQQMIAYKDIVQEQINIACVNVIAAVFKGYVSSATIDILSSTMSFIDHELLNGSFYESGYKLNIGTLLALTNATEFKEGMELLNSVAYSDSSNPIARITALRNLTILYAKNDQYDSSEKSFLHYLDACNNKEIAPEFPNAESFSQAPLIGQEWFFNSYLTKVKFALFRYEPWASSLTH